MNDQKVLAKKSFFSKSKSLGMLIILLYITGGFLVSWPYNDDRGLFYIESQLDIIKSQLQGLDYHLKDFKKENGRYPTNNEGLSSLNFDYKFELKAVDYGLVEESDDLGLSLNSRRFSWLRIKNAIREQRGSKDFIKGLKKSLYIKLLNFEEGKSFKQLDFAISSTNDLYLIGEGGVLSPWRLPYMYENRREMNPNIFSDSPVSSDQRYSLKVDDDIYIYSVGGAICAKKYDTNWRIRYYPRFLGYFLFTSALLLSFRKGFKKYLFALIFVVGGNFLGGLMATASCYIMSPLFYRRSPEAYQQQVSLLKKYYEQGVIRKRTYKKALYSLNNEYNKNSEKENRW